MGLKSRSIGVLLDLIKTLHESFAGVVINRNPFSAVFVGHVCWCDSPLRPLMGHSTNYTCQLDNNSQL